MVVEVVAVLIATELLYEGLSNWFWLELVFLKKLRKMNKYFYFQKIPVTEPVELEPFPWWLVKDILKENFWYQNQGFPRSALKMHKLSQCSSTENWKKISSLDHSKKRCFCNASIFFSTNLSVGCKLRISLSFIISCLNEIRGCQSC